MASLVVAWCLVCLVLCPRPAWTWCDGVSLCPAVVWVQLLLGEWVVCVWRPTGVLLSGIPAPYLSPETHSISSLVGFVSTSTTPPSVCLSFLLHGTLGYPWQGVPLFCGGVGSATVGWVGGLCLASNWCPVVWKSCSLYFSLIPFNQFSGRFCQHLHHTSLSMLCSLLRGALGHPWPQILTASWLRPTFHLPRYHWSGQSCCLAPSCHIMVHVYML